MARICMNSDAFVGTLKLSVNIDTLGRLARQNCKLRRYPDNT
jgi:hypothetical protein